MPSDFSKNALNLLDLPNELIALILVNISDVIHLSTQCVLVCKRFYRIIRSPDGAFWCSKFSGDFGTGAFNRLSRLNNKGQTSDFVEKIVRKCILAPTSHLFSPQGLVVSKDVITMRQEYLALDLPRSAAQLARWIFAPAGAGGESDFSVMVSQPVSCVNFHFVSAEIRHQMVECTLVNFVALGCPEEILDILRPKIQLGVLKLSKRHSCSLYAVLLDAKGTLLASFDGRDLAHEQHLVFRDYPAGVRFVLFRSPCSAISTSLILAPTVKFVLVDSKN